MAKEVKKAAPAPAKPKIEHKPVQYAFGRWNFIVMLIGLLFLALGFILMIGGGSDDPKVFNEAIFSSQRLTVAPILILLGFAIELVAIIKKARD